MMPSAGKVIRMRKASIMKISSYIILLLYRFFNLPAVGVVTDPIINRKIGPGPGLPGPVSLNTLIKKPWKC